MRSRPTCRPAVVPIFTSWWLFPHSGRRRSILHGHDRCGCRFRSPPRQRLQTGTTRTGRVRGTWPWAMRTQVGESPARAPATANAGPACWIREDDFDPAWRVRMLGFAFPCGGHRRRSDVVNCSNTAVIDGTACDFGGLPGICGGGACEDAMLCAGVDCDDGNECTEDIACDPTDGLCDYANVATGTICDFGGAAGVCKEGDCSADYYWRTATALEGEPGQVSRSDVAFKPNGDAVVVWAQTGRLGVQTSGRSSTVASLGWV